MRVLRSTVFPTPDLPMTVVTRDCDTLDSLESALHTLYQPEALVVHEIFTMPDAGIEEATMTAIARIDPERERNMAILYFWDASMLRNLSAGGVLSTDKPAPLNRREIELVLRQLVNHPDYRDQTITVHSERGELVRVRKGELA